MMHIKKIVIFTILLIAVGISNVYATEGTVTTDGVRVRKAPSTDSEIVTILNKSAQVEILEETNGWYKIKYELYGTYEGYMSMEFVKKDETQVVPTATPSTEPTQSPTQLPTEEPTTTPEIVDLPQTEISKSDLIGKKEISNQANMYILPIVTSSIKATVNKGDFVDVQEVAGNFAYVKYNNINGWIRINLLKLDDSSIEKNDTEKENKTDSYTKKTGYVNVQQAIVREQATTSSEMITALNLNDEVTIIGEEGDFYKIDVNGTEAYMAKRLISDTLTTTNRGNVSRQEQVTTIVSTSEVVETDTSIQTSESVETSEPTDMQTPNTPNAVATSSVGEQIAQMAQNYVGYNYVYGGANPSTGFDCSGLVYYICGQLGYKVNRTADYQVNNGVEIEKSNLQLGDLVFFTNYSTNRGIGHVGIYIGNNQFVHASSPSTGVIISSLNEPTYVKRYVTARRIGV